MVACLVGLADERDTGVGYREAVLAVRAGGGALTGGEGDSDARDAQLPRAILQPVAVQVVVKDGPQDAVELGLRVSKVDDVGAARLDAQGDEVGCGGVVARLGRILLDDGAVSLAWDLQAGGVLAILVGRRGPSNDLASG